MIPPVKVTFTEEMIDEVKAAVDQILSSGMLSNHLLVRKLEQTAASLLGFDAMLTTKCGQGALQVAAWALKKQHGVGMIVAPTNTYYASVAPFVRAGFEVTFADMESHSFCVSAQTVEAAISRIREKVVGVIVTNIGGGIPKDIEEIVQLARQSGAWVLEDCSHAHGAALGGKPAGTFGDIACFSLYATKVVTAGEGGLLASQDPELTELLTTYAREGKREDFVSVHEVFGFNERMSEIDAAVGLVSIRRLEEFCRERHKVARKYRELLGERVLWPANAEGEGSRCSWYKVYYVLPPGRQGREVRQAARPLGVSLPGFTYEIPLHRQVALFPDEPSCPTAEDLCSRHVCLPVWPGMSDQEIETVTLALQTVLNE